MKKIAAMLLMLGLLLTGCTPTVLGETTAPTVQTQPVQTQPPTEPERELDLMVLRCDGSGEYKYWTTNSLNRRNRPEAPRTMTVTFNGKSYTGTYRGSQISAPNTFYEDEYKGNKYKFRVHAETGKLTHIHLFHPREEGSETQAACEAIARAVVEQCTSLDGYTMEADSSESAYSFYFRRYLGGLPTNDSYYVAVLKTGKILYFDDQSGSFAPEALPREPELTRQLELLRSVQVQVALHTKGAETYHQYRNYKQPREQYNFSAEPKYLCMLPDGTLGMYCIGDLEVTFPTERGTTAYTGSVIDMVVKCQYGDMPLPESAPQMRMPPKVFTGTDRHTGLSLSAYRLSEIQVNYERIYGNEYGQPLQIFREITHDYDAPKEMTVELGGTELTERYGTSFQFPQEGQQIDCYMGEDWYFSVDHETGKPVAAQSAQWRAGQETLDSCQRKADAIAGDFGELSQWEQTRDAQGNLYRYIYTRYVPQEQVCHWMVVTLDSDMQLYSFFRGSLELPEGSGEVYLPQVQALLSNQGFELLARKRNELLDLLIEDRIVSIANLNYEGKPLPEPEDYLRQHMVYSMKLLVLPDGCLGARYHLDLNISTKMEHAGCKPEILVVCDGV